MPLSSIAHQTLELTGNIYSGNVAEIQQKIEYVAGVSNFLTLNLNQLTGMDISGAFMLAMVILNAKKRNKEIVLASVENEIVNSALRMAGVHRVLKLED